jgi:site-specific DNA-methyltransferase (adenine-specific)
MEYMAGLPDKAFDLAICDPPYGIEDMTGKEFSHGRGKLKNRILSKHAKKIDKWDKAPPQEYFNELFRVSKNQIIWGVNYFDLPKYRCPIVWDKCQAWENFSHVEIAWSSFNQPAKLLRLPMFQDDKIHPTQKPVALYKWLLQRFAKQGDTIFDSHLGSGSIRIACHDLGYDMVGCELDEEYYLAQEKRYLNHISNHQLFKGA